MSTEGLVLRGVRGLVSGHQVYLQPGFDGTVGRSRRADVCLKDAPGYIRASSQQDKEEEHFKTTSRKHIVVRVGTDGSVLIRDTSTNGTFINADRISEKLLTAEEIRAGQVMLRLGTVETFQLEWGDNPEATSIVDPATETN